MEYKKPFSCQAQSFRNLTCTWKDCHIPNRKIAIYGTWERHMQAYVYADSTPLELPVASQDDHGGPLDSLLQII